jgi:hypothetical protein
MTLLYGLLVTMLAVHLIATCLRRWRSPPGRRHACLRPAKWISIGICVLMLFVWCLTLRWEYGYAVGPYHVAIGGGSLNIGNLSFHAFPPRPLRGEFMPDMHAAHEVQWRSYTWRSGAIWHSRYPLWFSWPILFYVTLLLWLLDRRPQPGRCSSCGYDLTGNTSGVCPECGTPVSGRIRSAE